MLSSPLVESRSWLYLAGVVGVVAAVAVVAAPALAGQRVHLRSGDRVLLLGDSLAQGLTPPMRKLAQDAGLEFFGDGRPSTRLDQWLDQGWAEARIAEFRPTVALVSLGTNDAGSNFSSTFSDRAKALVAMAARYGTTILWIEPPTMPFSTQTVVSGARDSGAAVFRSQDVEIPRGPDNIHPTIGGFAAWSALIWQSMDPPTASAPSLSGTAPARVRPPSPCTCPTPSSRQLGLPPAMPSPSQSPPLAPASSSLFGLRLPDHRQRQGPPSPYVFGRKKTPASTLR